MGFGNVMGKFGLNYAFDVILGVENWISWVQRMRRKFIRLNMGISTLQAWHKIVLFSAHVQINLEKLITSS